MGAFPRILVRAAPGTELQMPYGVALMEDCLACVWREDGLFCRLPADALRQLKSIRQTTVYPPGALLFAEGEKPRGLFILCSVMGGREG